MKKNDTLKKKKWLKARRRLNGIKRNQNYIAKTIHKPDMTCNLVPKKEEEKLWMI